MPSPASVRSAAVVALLLASPAVLAEDAPPAARCTVPGAGDWREYTSAHFVLSTDASRKRASSLVRQLEEVHSIVVRALFGDDAEIPGRVRVVAFASPGELEAIAPSHPSGLAFSTPGETWIVFADEGRDAPGAIVGHALTHAVSWHRFPRQPQWFREGLAEFMQTAAEIQRELRNFTEIGHLLARGERWTGGRFAGFASSELLERAAASGSVSARELLGWRGRTDEGGQDRLRGASWVLYHWLSNERAKELSGYEDRLAKGEDPAAAWRAAFPDLDPASDAAMARLDRALAAYRRDGRYLSFHVRPGKVRTSAVERAIPAAELHVLRVALRDAAGAAPAALARADWAEAAREDPLLPAAAAGHARDEGRSVAAALAPVTESRPADARGWFLLGDALDPAVDPQEKEAALRRAVALAPEDARMNVTFASFLLSTGRAKEARPFADRALDLAPWDPHAVETLAAVALGIGQCKPASDLQRRAAELFAADDPAGSAARGRAAEYEARCAKGPVAASDPQGR